MVVESLNISRETYFAIVLDRAMQGPVLVGSPEGGVDIEEVAASRPEKIFKVSLFVRAGSELRRNPSNMDTLGPECVLVIEVSLFQGLTTQYLGR